MDGASSSKSRCCRLISILWLATLPAAAGCAPYIGTTYKSFLRQARENPDPNIRYIAYAKLGSPGLYDNAAQKGEAVRALIARFQEGREPVAVRAAIIRSLGNLRDRRARDVVVKAAGDVENPVIRIEACRALGKIGLPEDATLLARIMTIDKLEDCRIAAIESLGALKSDDPRIYQILLDGMDHDDPAIRLECLRALREITHKDLGVDPAAWRRELAGKLAPEATSTPSSKPAARSPSTKAAALVRDTSSRGGSAQ
jgi:HEAT repeat protein